MNNLNHKDIPIISLFCGPGGMDLGFRKQGFVPIVAIDSDRSAVDSYNRNDKRGIALIGDLSELSSKDIIASANSIAPGIKPRGVIGGPPCQCFSFSNVHRKKRDPRRQLARRYAEILAELNGEYELDFFVFENVVGLKSEKHNWHWKRILTSLGAAGFIMSELELQAADFGVPQKRKRLFIVGINKNLYPGVKVFHPEKPPSGHLTVREAIDGLPHPTFFRRGLKETDIVLHPNHWTMNPKSPKFQSNYRGKGRSFRMLRWDQPSWTVAYGHREIHVHPSGTRRLSIYEAMLLQGFPKDYVLCGNLSAQVIQVSDAVPPPVAEAISKSIKQTIYERKRAIQNNLLFWYDQHKRAYPWRQTSEPYHILIAEKLLQQTAASDAVTKAFIEITTKYPTIYDLAKALVSDLTKIVRPLGLHYRASEIRRLAMQIVTHFNGRIPNNLKMLKRLVGIGDYSARAILSFAYQQDVPIVDTNVARILCRLYMMTSYRSQNPARSRLLIDVAAALLSNGKSRDFNLGLLDLASLVCKKKPLCWKCPIRNECSYGVSNSEKTQDLKQD